MFRRRKLDRTGDERRDNRRLVDLPNLHRLRLLLQRHLLMTTPRTPGGTTEPTTALVRRMRLTSNRLIISVRRLQRYCPRRIELNNMPSARLHLAGASTPVSRRTMQSMTTTAADRITPLSVAQSSKRFTPWGTLQVSSQGGELNEAFTVSQSGTITSGTPVFEEAAGIARAGMLAASGEQLPGNPRDAIATVSTRINKFIQEYVDNFLEQAKKSSGNDPETVRAAEETAKQISYFARQGGRAATKKLAGDLGISNYKDVSTDDLQYNAVRIGSDEDRLRTAMAADPTLAQKVTQDYGQNIGQLLNGKMTILQGDEGAYELGNRSMGGGGGGTSYARGRGSFWGGGLGNLLYGAYIAKRFWSMTAAPVFQDMDAYAKTESALAPLDYYGSGAAMDLSGSAGGYLARQAHAQQVSGQAAYEEFGALSDLGNALMSNPSVARLSASGRVIGGMGIGAYVFGKTDLVGRFLGTEAGAATHGLAPALGVGTAALAGVSLGTEAYNMLQEAGITPYLGEKMGIGSFGRFLGRWGVAAEYQLATAMGGQEMAGQWARKLNDTFPALMNWLTVPERNADATGSGQIRETLDPIAGRMGVKIEDLAGSFMVAQRAYGKPIEAGSYEAGRYEELVGVAKRRGVDEASYWNQASSYAETGGLIPGTRGFFQAAADFGAMDEADQTLAMEKAGRRKSFGSALAPYLSGGWRAGANLADKLGVEKESDLTAVLAAFGSANEYGADLDAAGGDIAQLAKKLGIRSTRMSSELAGTMMDLGFSDWGNRFPPIGSTSGSTIPIECGQPRASCKPQASSAI